jgi:hypothetical protein
MTNFGYLPFEKLNAHQEARKLLAAVREAAISEARLRDQALRAATSVCLNVSGGRWTKGRCGQGTRLRHRSRREL